MQEAILLEMLEIACGLLEENEICSYCKAKMYGDCRGCITYDFCTVNIFDGLEIEAKKRLNKQKNESGPKCA